ncbi:MAG: ABC transporter permease [Azoarcus sp.]|jgi:sulfonate transport system permease protein|nr:ABC transporter permease [Azoarcus sp.]
MNTQILSFYSPATVLAGKAWRQALARVVNAVSRFALALSFPLALLGLWQLAHALEWVPAQILPGPSQTWQTFWDLFREDTLPEGKLLSDHLSISLARVAWSVLAGALAGLLLGFVIGLSPRARVYLRPSFEVFAQFPVIGWIPLLMLFLGIDEALKIVTISFAVAVPVLVNTYKGLLGIPPSLLEVGRVYEFDRWQALTRIVIPAALPSIFSGLRQGTMQAWLSLIFVELLASSEGLGFLMIWARQLMYMDIVFVCIIAIGVIGYLLDWTLRQVESYFNAWNPRGL